MQPQTHSSPQCRDSDSAGRMKRVACLRGLEVCTQASARVPVFLFFISIDSGGLTAPSALRGLPPERARLQGVCGLQSQEGVDSLLFLPREKVSDFFKGALSDPIKVPVPPVEGCIIEMPSKNRVRYENQTPLFHLHH